MNTYEYANFMRTPDFLEDVALGNNLINQFEIANNAYLHTMAKIKIDEGWCFSSIVEYIVESIIKSTRTCPSEYLEKESTRLCHEFAIEIYWRLLSTSDFSKFKKEKNESFVEAYADIEKPEASLKSIYQTFTRRHTAMQKEFNPENVKYYKYNLHNHYDKYCDYARILGGIQEGNRIKLYKSKTQKGIPNIDYCMYVYQHMHSIYRKNFFFEGCSFTKFFSLVEQYERIHKQDLTGPEVDAVTSELSAFVFERLHYACSYSKLMYSFVVSDFIKEKLPSNFTLLRYYTSLFNTHYLSLIDYIQDKYEDRLVDSFSEDKGYSVAYDTYLEFEFNAKYLIPLVYHILVAILYSLFKGKRDEMISYLEKTIAENILNNENTYRKEIYNIYADINELGKSLHLYQERKKTDQTLGNKKNSKKKYTSEKTKAGILFPENKNDRTFFKYSCHMSKEFFHAPTANFLQVNNPYIKRPLQKTEETLDFIHHKILTQFVNLRGVVINPYLGENDLPD